MDQYGLIGWPLGHSFSQRYFTEKFEREGIRHARYDLFPMEQLSGFPHWAAHLPGLKGLNVTIPHKEAVISCLDLLDDTAREIGAVNCIKALGDGRLMGFNTDAIGFEISLLRLIGTPAAIGQALILGSGGAAKAVAYVLKKLEIDFKIVSRKPEGPKQIAYEEISALNAGLLINTTPAGMYPRVTEMPPAPLFFFRPGLFVYDLIYNPDETLLLHEAKIRGCEVKNGLEMLHLQAEAAWDIWQSPDPL